MRTRTSSFPLTASASACALLLALTLTACGDDGESLPAAANTEGVAAYLNENLSCVDPDYFDDDEMSVIQAQVSGAVDGGGECDLDEDSDIDFLHITNMKQFQKDVAASGESGESPLLVGMNFALDVDRESAVRSLLDNGLMLLDCEPGMQTPQQYKRVEAEAGCVLTNYVRE
ncbi:hypothetical protein [Streptomyces sp. DSM 40750]|uniref:hypothetical protein n=1 Tax=Streptomyces sp. DSM 40750 TaxID=2801030 RepID=UPI00214C37EE|nr:hypothetical protein [Streptomyces sp. DSM 40750]UUU23858.1 hypothetical protein JIX55_28385 [Streptomyces sp. DSM 40750]